MSFEIIASIVAPVSFFGMSLVILKAAPRLREMPEPEIFARTKDLRKKIGERTKEVLKENSDNLESLLHKILSKVRILSMKVDTKASGWILKLRNRSLERTKGLDDYWNDIKASVKKKKD